MKIVDGEKMGFVFLAKNQREPRGLMYDLGIYLIGAEIGIFTNDVLI